VTKEVRAMRGLGLPAVLVMLCCGATAGAAEDGAAAGRPMRIGTRHAPPFAIRGSDGTWSGISIDLWEEIADNLGLSYEYREYGLAELLEATRAGDITAVLPGGSHGLENRSDGDIRVIVISVAGGKT
jgi:ABC-type amino acid transport substrate-binding protein